MEAHSLHLIFIIVLYTHSVKGSFILIADAGLKPSAGEKPLPILTSQGRTERARAVACSGVNFAPCA